MVTLKCLKCGHLFTKLFWAGFAGCPKCGARETAPVLTAPLSQPVTSEKAAENEAGQNFCNACRVWSPGNYCHNCGSKLSTEATTKQDRSYVAELSQNKYCLKCGVQLVPDTKFCASCGASASALSPQAATPIVKKKISTFWKVVIILIILALLFMR